MSSLHEDSAGLPSSGGLMHGGHHGPASGPPGSQPEGFTGETFDDLLFTLMSQRGIILPTIECNLTLTGSIPLIQYLCY